jgi:hydrophobic/amphiphilic exporter-1 (mainly G- bacteria), HAE1 family
MNLTKLFVQRPTLAFVLIALIALAGAMAAPQIVQQQYPNVEQPTISVSVSYSGASPTVMRDSIVLPIEDQIAGAPDLQTLNSTIQGGQASISATFTLNSNVNTDLVNVQKAVQSASRNLPSDLTAPTVRNRDPSERVVVTLSVQSKSLDAAQLSLLVNGRLIPAMEQIPGISNVNASGLVTPAYEVQVNPSALSAYGYTLTDVVNTIGANNVRAPGGIAYEPNRETNIDVRGDIVDAESIAGLVLQGAPTQVPDPIATIGPSNPWTVAPALRRVGDVAQVTAAYEPRRQYAAVNGQPGLFLSIQKQSNVSEVTASNNVLAALPQLRRQYPQLTFGIVEVQSHVTEQQLSGVLRTLAEAIVLTAIVMLFFLHSWRNAIVVMIAIPTSLCVTLFAMWLMGLTLDTVSLLGMTLVIGVLVDDSTVVLENIERHHEELHEEPKTAAVRGRSEIGLAAIVITLVDVVVFLPIAFLQGNQVGRQLAEFGIVVTISTLVSLFISFTITPTLAGLWALKSTWQAPWIIHAFTDNFDRVRAWYTKRVLSAGLRHPKVVVGISLFSFVGAFLLLPLGLVGQEFIPGQDQGEIFVQFNYPTGTPLSVTHAAVTKVEQRIDKIADLSAETTVSGAYAASFGGFVSEGNVGQIHVFLKDDRKQSTDYWTREIQRIARQLAPAAHPVVVNSSTTSGGNKQPIDYLVTDVSGNDPTQDALRVVQILQDTPGATAVNSSATALQPQVAVVFNRDKARALNVSIGTASTAIRAAFGGAIATQFETPDGLEQVQVIYPVSEQTALATISAIPIRTIDGKVVHVGDIATFQNDPAPPIITRVDRNTVIHVNANVAPGSSLSVVQAAFQKRLAAARLPANIVVRPAPLGQQDLMGQALRGLGTTLVLSIVLVFLLMVALYNSYVSPFIILFAVPVATVGAFGALWLTHQTLNLFSLIGCILLVGLVTKNGILLVDYANTLREDHGFTKLDAIVESAHTRFRPIVMTTASMIAAMIPLALSLEAGSEVRRSLGIVVIGGLTSSLLLTLVLVPVMYMWLAPAHIHSHHIDDDEEPSHPEVRALNGDVVEQRV